MTYASEEMFLEVELDVRVLLDHLEDLDCLIDDLMRYVSAFPSCLAEAVTSGPTPSPAPIESAAVREAGA
jgi:hypothetical protein